MEEKIQYFAEKQEAIRRHRMELMQLEGKFNDEFKEWIKSIGVNADQFSIVDVMKAVVGAK